MTHVHAGDGDDDEPGCRTAEPVSHRVLRSPGMLQHGASSPHHDVSFCFVCGSFGCANKHGNSYVNNHIHMISLEIKMLRSHYGTDTSTVVLAVCACDHMRA